MEKLEEINETGVYIYLPATRVWDRDIQSKFDAGN